MLPSRRRMLQAGLAADLGLVPRASTAASLPSVEVWKDPSCGCCTGWVEHLRKAGFQVRAHDVEDIDAIKRARHVPEALASCHTALVAGYVIEGHVPASDVKRLLAEKPKARGLAVPGMPMDAPGMDGNTGKSYQVFQFGEGEPILFARH